MKKSTKSLLLSGISLLLCIAMLAGTTLAWFTDSVSSGLNVINGGNLDIEMYWSTDLNGLWINAEDESAEAVFNYDKWEPGYTEVRYVKIVNAGSLAFKYALSIIANGEVSELADVIDVYFVEAPTANIGGRAELDNMSSVGTLRDAIEGKIPANGVLLPNGKSAEGFYSGEIIVAIALKMRTDVGNDYMGLSACEGGFSLRLDATQYDYEKDSFGDDYDNGTKFPEMKNFDVVFDVPVENGAVINEITVQGDNFVVTVPAGVKTQGTLGASVKEKDHSDANITVGDDQIMRPVDVHVEGLAEDNTVPIIINLGEVMPKGLNIGNYTLYHVENGTDVAMTAVGEVSQLDVHNEFFYDPATGEVTVAMASFSEVALVADTENAWEGEFDYTWYDASKTELTIANADQLAAFGAIVGGMKKVTGRVDNKYTYSDEVIQDSFEGKTVKLIADINLGDKESENNPNLIFYPIGYWNNEGTYERKPVEERTTAVSSGLYTFNGTFDGNGHTVSNFYQNTWEMKGDHDWYDTIKEQYYRDGMGLFGRVYKGTIKNLTVREFKSDGEIATTGVIAAYADGATFENIAIFNCNPRVYNIGNGGIVGCVGWYAKEAGLKTTFKNITVDNSNKISALWGSYDVACGGIVGQYYPTSGQSSANKPANGGVHFENCHISAQMDVYNDVCANYQYYAYRYTGMLIGSVRENVTMNGHSYPKMDGITAKDCTVHFGTWNDYYYCEIIDNTTASYTHDYQMSRLTEIKAIDGTTITYLDDTTGTVPASGRANYVIVDYSKGHGTENATCYHFKDGAVWNHEDAGYHNGENGEKYIDENKDGVADLKEDKQHIYLEFNNLVTGYGWGVTTKGVGDLAGVTILDREEGTSVEKFEGKVDSLENDKTYTLGDIFSFVDNGVELVPDALAVGITNFNENNPVSADIAYDRENWANSTITFIGEGDIQITIQDYYFCIPTTITVKVKTHKHVYDNSCDTTCNDCGEEREITHNYETEVTAPTCTAGGYTTYTCSVCGNTYTDNSVVALGHKYDAVVTVPTCTATGYTTYTCSVCSHSYIGNETVATGHTEVTDAAVAATCTTTGLTEGKHCSVCNEVLVAQNTVAALGHTEVTDVAQAPTCTETGLAEGKHCSVCNEVLVAQATVAALGHTWVNATCTEAKYCSVCFATDGEALGHITKKFTSDKFTYRVGNQNEVQLSSLFNVGKHSVTVDLEKIAGNVSVEINGTSLKFNGTGVVKVILTSDCNCDECVRELKLEVVDAVNATTAMSATENNVVLLNDCGFGSLEVSGGYTLYGNGFAMTCGSDSYALDTGYAFVNLDNGTLDNVQIVLPNFDHAVLYKSNMTESGNRSHTDDKGTTRYYNVKSGVMVSGNSQILNSRISGARAAVNVTGGNCVIDNSRLECGAVASLLVGSANSLTLRDVTLVQKPTASTYDSSKKLMGFSVLVICNADGSSATINLEGELIQNAWVDESYKQYVPSAGQKIIADALKQTDYLHDLDGDGTKESLNLGIAYMPQDTSGNVGTSSIYDQRSNKNETPYDYASVSATKVYSYKNTYGTAESFKNESEYNPNKQGDIITVTYSDTTVGLENGKFFETDGWVYELKVDLDKVPGYKLDFSKVVMMVNGATVTDFKVNGSAKPSSVAVTAGGVTYALAASIDGKEYTATFKVTGTETTKESPSLVASNYAAALLVGEEGNTFSKDTWHGAAPALEGVQIKYWSVAEKQYKTIKLSDYTPTTAGKQNGTNKTWTYSPANGDFTLTLTGGQVHSSNKVDSMPVVFDGKLYFVSAASNGLVNFGNDARTFTVTYSFRDNNGGTELTFSHTWSIECTDKATAYDYSDFCQGKSKTFTIKSSNGGCVTPDTLVTLADGTQKRIDQVTYADKILVWNFYTGKYDFASASILMNHGASTVNVTTLNFADGTSINTINGHGFFDVATNEFVLIDEFNAADYIGHEFVKQDGDGYSTVELVSYSVEEQYTEVWSILTAEHYNCMLEGMWTVTAAEVENSPEWLMPYEIGEDMKYDESSMQADIAEYGLYTYDDFAEYMTYEQFKALGLGNFKVSVGKGYITWEEILYLISIHISQ